MRGRGGWSGGGAGGRHGVLPLFFPHRKAFPTTGRIWPGTWVSLLLSFGRGRPERIIDATPAAIKDSARHTTANRASTATHTRTSLAAKNAPTGWAPRTPGRCLSRISPDMDMWLLATRNMGLLLHNILRVMVHDSCTSTVATDFVSCII